MPQVNMGERTLLQTRVSDEIAARVDADAKAAGLKRSQYLADLLAQIYDAEPPSVMYAPRGRRREKRRPSKDQQTLALAEHAEEALQQKAS
jgi:hypothetical protein